MRLAVHVARIGARIGTSSFGAVDLREKNYLEDQGIDRRIILRVIFRKWHGKVMDWFDLAQDRGRWRMLVNAVMNFRVP